QPVPYRRHRPVRRPFRRPADTAGGVQLRRHRPRLQAADGARRRRASGHSGVRRRHPAAPPAPVRSPDPALLVDRRYPRPGSHLAAAGARSGHHHLDDECARRSRDGAVHELGERAHAPRSGSVGADHRHRSRLQAPHRARTDAVPDHAVHAAGPRLERADLVPVPAWLPDRQDTGEGWCHHHAGGRGRPRAGAWRRSGVTVAPRERAMSRHTLLDRTGATARPAPVMPSACESGGCGSASAVPRRPPPPSFGTVTVNGVEIEPEAIAQEMQHHPAPDGETAWREAARALALRELLLQEARRLGIEADPEEIEDGGREIEEDAVIRSLLERRVEPAKAGEDECRRYYESCVDRFRTPDLYEASHILIEPDGDE